MFQDRAHWADKAFWWVAPIVILVSAAGGAFYYFHSRKEAAQSQSQVPPSPPWRRATEPAIRHPIPGTATEDTQPLPPLNESDPAVSAALEHMFGDLSMKQMLVPDGIVRRIVVTIDNLPRQKVAVEKRPLKPIEGQTATTISGDAVTLSAENFARHAIRAPGARHRYPRRWPICTSASIRCSSSPTRISAIRGSTSTTGWWP